VPGAALASLLPLTCGVKLQPGQSVLVNGATGFAGKLAVQMARLCGAARIVATGRDSAALQSLTELGADAVIDLKRSDGEIVDAFKQAAGESGYHIILDFLWGLPTELLIESLTPNDLSFARHRTRLVQIGKMAGSKIALPADALRTSGLEIVGAGGGITPEGVGESAKQVWAWIKAGQLRFEIERVPLQDIESAWTRSEDLHGKRIVIMP
jgi:NADPH2:quinone reductase